MSTPKRQTLSVDLDQLFPGGTVTIGDQSIIIKPLGIEEIANLFKKARSWAALLSEAGVTVDNYTTSDNLFKIASVLLVNAPDILEEAANLDIEDIKKLPLEIIVEIVSKIIEVNLKSKKDLEKNFKSLMKMLLPKEKIQVKEPSKKKKKK